jgi:SPP1 family predicted phage head-tail adaptor
MYVNPGELDKKIKIVQLVNGERDKDGFSAEKVEKTIRSCYAKVTNTSGTELVKANSDFSEVKKRFLVRYSPEKIEADMYVRYAGKFYDITYVNTYGDQKEYTEIWGEVKERQHGEADD